MSNDEKGYDPTSSDSDHIKIPVTLTIRDMVLVIAAVVSMVTAWGIFGTRLSVVEEKIIFISSNMKDIRMIVKEIKKEDAGKGSDFQEKLDNLELRLRNLETKQAEIRILLNQKYKKGN